MARKLVYETPEALNNAVDVYMDACRENDKVPTMSGLAFALGISRQALLDYKGRGSGYADAIEIAKQLVEDAQEQQLFTKNARGAAFALANNFGWAEKRESKQTVRQTTAIDPAERAALNALAKVLDDAAD